MVPGYRERQPNQTYGVRITKENLLDRTVRLTTYRHPASLYSYR